MTVRRILAKMVRSGKFAYSSKDSLAVEYSKSSKSRCRSCSQVIEKGIVRIALSSLRKFGNRYGTRKYFYHPKCFFEESTLTTMYSSKNDFNGFETLRKADASNLLYLLTGMLEIDSNNSKGKIDKDINKKPSLRHEVANPAKELLDTGLPEDLVQKLLPFQKQGVAFALSVAEGRVMIADEMGLGKTVQAIAFATAFKQHWPVLIIAPSSVKLNWADELEKWLLLEPGSINFVNSRSDAGNVSESKFTIATYGMFTKRSAVAEVLKKHNFKIVILDESHYIKNQSAERTKLISPIIRNSIYCALLSGTPALARPVELYSQVSSVRPDLFGCFRSYVNKFCDPKRRPWGMDYNGSSNLTELNSILRQFMVRRLKNDVLTQLPTKRRQRVRLEIGNTNEMKELQNLKKQLDNIDLNSLINAYEETDYSFDKSEVSALNRERNNQRRLLTSIFAATGKAKLPAVCDYVIELAECTEKFIVFAHHHETLDGIEQALVRKKIPYFRIDGSTSPKDRHDYVSVYQSNDSKYRVALLGVTSAGQGLTLTAANTVVFAELHWTPGVLSQAEDRAHRIGQKSAVNVIYLIGKNTIDDILWPMILRKIKTVTTALDGEERQLKATLAENDLSSKEKLNSAGSHNPAKEYPSGDMRAWLTSRKDVTPESKMPDEKNPICIKCALPYDKTGEKAMVFCEKCNKAIHLECGQLELCTEHKQCIKKRNEHLKYYTCESCVKEAYCQTDLVDLSENSNSVICLTDVSKVYDETRFGSNDPQAPICKDDSDFGEFKMTSPEVTSRKGWVCSSCTLQNTSIQTRCQACGLSKVASVKRLSRKSLCDDDIEDFKPEKKPPPLLFKVSKETGRVFLYNDREEFLGITFNVEDVVMNNFNVFPENIQNQSSRRREIKQFAQAWMKLKASERKALCGETVKLPLYPYLRAIKSKMGTIDNTPVYKRYLSTSSAGRSQEVMLFKSPLCSPAEQRILCNNQTSSTCVHCEKTLDETLQKFEIKYCSADCYQNHTIKLNSSNIRRQLFDLEHGVCQLCEFDCHDLYLKLNSVTPPERLQLLMNTKFKTTNALLEEPKEGMLWQADHIRAVAEGGGQCSIFNFRTLCTPCHQRETNKLIERLKKAKASEFTHDIRTFFTTISSTNYTGVDERITTTNTKKRRRLVKKVIFSDSESGSDIEKV